MKWEPIYVCHEQGYESGYDHSISITQNIVNLTTDVILLPKTDERGPSFYTS